MKKYSEINTLNDTDFQRTVGLPKDRFNALLLKIMATIKDAKSKNPLMTRGLKGTFSIEDKLLLTLYYLRHYPTFIILGNWFNISESYAHDIYQKFSSMLVKILHIKGPKSLASSNLSTILIDVTEQPIERPKKKQKEYYSGKKIIPSKFRSFFVQ